MRWIKQGLIYKPDGTPVWAQNSALTPTPLLMGDTIRVYAGFRDNKGVSRIGYVDLDADNPSRILSISKQPVLDIGSPGNFDDNGVILGDVVSHGQNLWMYYVGFQHVEKVKFLAFTGLAISRDGGNFFERVRQTPVLDRSDEGLFIRAIHSVQIEQGIWRVWYAAGSGWTYIDGKPYPDYHIRYLESRDGMNFGQEGQICIQPIGNEYRIGRPRVYRSGDAYWMFYTKGTTLLDYLPGYAESHDNLTWIRKDAEVGIELSSTGWDSQTLCYPSLVKYKKNTYVFYNGNNMGADGFGYAILGESV
jgi:predicted GH43/DUF377 family glycosyl hydrolase